MKTVPAPTPHIEAKKALQNEPNASLKVFLGVNYWSPETKTYPAALFSWYSLLAILAAKTVKTIAEKLSVPKINQLAVSQMHRPTIDC